MIVEIEVWDRIGLWPCTLSRFISIHDGPGMFERALMMYSMAVLALLIPLPAKGQLPDAPSAVYVRQRARATAFVDDGDSMETSRRTAGVSSSSGSQWALADADDMPMPRQSLTRPTGTNLGPGRPVLTEDLRRVPGEVPSLYSACPADACALAEDRMCCGEASSPFAKYLKRPGVVPMTSRDNLRSAVQNVIDPFNFLTIAVDAAFATASDPYSPYGPGLKGAAKYAGVSLTEDMTGEFFGTYLVPSIAHQDPHYHREPFMPIRHRILHSLVQVFWSRSYTGRPMPNYANLVGGVATAVVSNTFVPGPNRQGFDNTAERLALAFAISPSGNLIEEFLPDIANRINLRVVIFQRILNRVTFEESGVR